MIKNIIFDLGGVLFDWNPDYVYASYFKTDEGLSRFYETTGIKILNNQFDKGLEILPALKQKGAEFPEYAEALLMWKTHWQQMLKGEISTNVEIAFKLSQAGYPMYALTNWAEENFPYARENFKVLGIFKDILVSGTEKLIKPDPQIYKLLFERNNLNPKDCLFIDDSKPNIEEANRQGVTTIHLKPETSLADELKKLGVKF